MEGLTKIQINNLPKYVRLNNACLRLYNPDAPDGYGTFFGWNPYNVVYYRDAGLWYVGIRIDDSGKIYSKNLYDDELTQLDNVELTPCSKQQWFKSNEGRIRQKTKAYTFTQKEYKPLKYKDGY